MSLIKEWIEKNPPVVGDGWDPFPLSLRLVNWIKYLSLNYVPEPDKRLILRSAYRQALVLERSLELHLLANHLFENAKALFFCGLFFRSRDGNRWLSRGAELLGSEIDEQILPDGGHFERSPLYHSLILDGCLDLLNACKARMSGPCIRLTGQLRVVLPKMMNFLSGMTHPDSQICLFNDSAFSIAAPPDALKAYFEELIGEKAPHPRASSWSFPETGYYVMAARKGERLLVDCGPIGPDYQPGHSHCDTLSFELSVARQRIIVDSGCFEYQDGPARQYNRGNSGHNTVTIDGLNQSEVWAAHRCARRARPIYARLREFSDGVIIFEGAHDGYARLNGNPIHHRRILATARGYVIEDTVEGGGIHGIESRLHIHPDCSLEFTGEGANILKDGILLANISLLGPGLMQERTGWYSPEFGIRKECVVLAAEHRDISLPHRGGWIIRTHAGAP